MSNTITVPGHQPPRQLPRRYPTFDRCGMAYGHSHGNASLPIILAGGTKLGFQHGQHIDFNLTKDFMGYDKHPGIYHSAVNSKAHLSNLLLTMAQKMDVPVEKFADSNGTVSELLG